jgi:hypothetical protein
VARQVESAVRYALGRDLGREPVDVTIRVDGLVQPDGGMPSPSDPEPEPDAAQAEADDGATAGLDAEFDAGRGTTDPAAPTAALEAEVPLADGGAAGRAARP